MEYIGNYDMRQAQMFFDARHGAS